MCFKPLTIRILLQNSEDVKRLVQEKDAALKRVSELEIQLKKERARMADVQLMNLELIDTLKSYGYKFRPAADVRTWGK